VPSIQAIGIPVTKSLLKTDSNPSDQPRAEFSLVCFLGKNKTKQNKTKNKPTTTNLLQT
jgi:hypothetical protein